MRIVLTLQQFVFNWKLCLKVTLFSIDECEYVNEFKDNSNQVSAQQTTLTESIISKKCLIKAKPGVKDFA